MLVFTDSVLSDIGKNIASYEPERGGALLGLPYTNVICRFVADPEAHTSHVVYQPSVRLQQSVRQQEISNGLQFFGIVHSHPGSFSRPSSQDHVAFLNSLSVNPHLSTFVAPIVTLDRTADPEQRNEVALDPGGRLTLYVAYRPKQEPEPDALYLTDSRLKPRASSLWSRMSAGTVERDVTVLPMDCSIMPVGLHVASVVQGLAEKSIAIQRSSGFLSMAGSLFQTETLRGQSFEIIFLFPSTYPISKPFLLFTRTDAAMSEDTCELEFKWPFGGGHNQVLWTAVGASVLEALGGVGQAFPKKPATVDVATAIDRYSRGLENERGPQSAPESGTPKPGCGGNETSRSESEGLCRSGRTDRRG